MDCQHTTHTPEPESAHAARRSMHSYLLVSSTVNNPEAAFRQRRSIDSIEAQREETAGLTHALADRCTFACDSA